MNTKYPRIPHLPWSPGATRDDRRLGSVDSLLNAPIVITEKMDGSNVCLAPNAVYARSHGSVPTHPSFNELKSIHATLRGYIPGDCFIYGEWCFARHSISYEKDPPHLQVFALLDTSTGIWSPFAEVRSMVKRLLEHSPLIALVPELFCGTVETEVQLKTLVDRLAKQPSFFGPDREGLVVRWAGPIPGDSFSVAVAKWVRANHVQTDKHWSRGPIVRHGRNQG